MDAGDIMAKVDLVSIHFLSLVFRHFLKHLRGLRKSMPVKRTPLSWGKWRMRVQSCYCAHFLTSQERLVAPRHNLETSPLLPKFTRTWALCHFLKWMLATFLESGVRSVITLEFAPNVSHEPLFFWLVSFRNCFRSCGWLTLTIGDQPTWPNNFIISFFFCFFQGADDVVRLLGIAPTCEIDHTCSPGTAIFERNSKSIIVSCFGGSMLG